MWREVIRGKQATIQAYGGRKRGFLAKSSSILPLLGSGHQTCMKLSSAECTVENS